MPIVLMGRQDAMLDALERSAVAHEILGAGLMEALIAVRRHEVVLAKERRSRSWSNGSASPGRSRRRTGTDGGTHGRGARPQR